MSENYVFSGTEHPVDLRPVCKFEFVHCNQVEKQSALSAQLKFQDGAECGNNNPIPYILIQFRFLFGLNCQRKAAEYTTMNNEDMVVKSLHRNKSFLTSPTRAAECTSVNTSDMVVKSPNRDKQI